MVVGWGKVSHRSSHPVPVLPSLLLAVVCFVLSACTLFRASGPPHSGGPGCSVPGTLQLLLSAIPSSLSVWVRQPPTWRDYVNMEAGGDPPPSGSGVRPRNVARVRRHYRTSATHSHRATFFPCVGGCFSLKVVAMYLMWCKT